MKIMGGGDGAGIGEEWGGGRLSTLFQTFILAQVFT